MTLSKQLLQQILDSVDAHTLLIRRSRIILANLSARTWLAMSQEDFQSCSLRDLVHPSTHHVLFQIYQQLGKGEASVSERLSVKHPTRGDIWIDATIKAADYFDEKEGYLLVTFEPSSDFLENAALPQPLLTRPLSSNTSDIVPPPDLGGLIDESLYIDNALDDFLVTLYDIIPYDSASISLVDDGIMRFVASRGFDKELFDQDFTIEIEKFLEKSVEIIHEKPHGTVQIINNTYNHPDWVQIEGGRHVKAWMGVALKHNNKVLGILNIDSSRTNFFTKDYARYALALSQQAIIALVYTRLYQQFFGIYEEQRRLQQILVKNLISTETMYAAQDLLFSSDDFTDSLPDLVNIISSSMDETRIIMIIFNLATGRLLHKIDSSEDETDLWNIFQQVTEQTDLNPNTMPDNNLIFSTNGTIKLVDGSQGFATAVNQRGALIVVRDEQAAPFDETDRELIITIANQVSIALENEILYAQLRQHTQNLERLVDRRTAQLSVERKRLRAILDSTAEGIFYMENFKIQYANPAFCRMVGYELDDLYGKPLSYIRVAAEQVEQRDFGSLLNNPLEVELGRSETRLRHQNGTEFYASIRFSLVGQPGEDPVRMVAIARDISQERQLYIQRARFIANAAHELRTPLSSLILRLHMLRRQPDRMEKHLESLDSVTGYLKDLVEELLTLSRFERGTVSLDKTEIVLQDSIRQASDEQSSFAEEQGVIVQVDMPEAPILAKVDSKRFHQMISNLVINGINYSGSKDHVYITLDVEVDPVGNKNAIIHVIDEGAGIEADLLPHDIFEPFTRPSGGSRKETGMGLALVREIATLHGGSVHAKSKFGEGATFRVSLPLN